MCLCTLSRLVCLSLSIRRVYVYVCVPFHLRDGKCALRLFIFAFCYWIWPLTLSLTSFPPCFLSLPSLHLSDYLPAVPLFTLFVLYNVSIPLTQKHATLLSVSTSTVSSFSRLFSTSPPPTPILPLAGCKMDSPQSESSGEGQKAEENRAQGEIQRGRRHSAVLRALSTFPLLYF